jgi:hypothetical protein
MSLTFQLYGAALLVSLGLFAIKGIPLLRQWLRGRFSTNWPWTKISVESGEISVALRGRSGDPALWELKVEYSYSVEGTRYLGTYRHCLDSKSEAEDLLKSLRELPPPVRYHPRKPEKSLLDPYRDAALAYEG